MFAAHFEMKCSGYEYAWFGWLWEQEEKESAEKAFKDIGEAYSVLSDPQVETQLLPDPPLIC
jgi:hypothetical protein